ncbi:redoxin domain-containing protein [Candidatus Poribacteria bacterium]|nr:redoxin domain-containing protein [Candidatus Poribacteria bacterium]
MRDSYKDIKETGAIVIGVSLDDIETQKKFKNELDLPFDLISDSEKKVSKAFNVLNEKGTAAKRKTFIITPGGKIAYIFNEVNVSNHGEEVLNKLKELQK